MGSILIKHGLVLSMNERIGTISDGAVYIEGDEIVDVGKTSTLLQKYRGETVIDASNMVVLPGLVNTHVHFYQSVLRGSCDTAPLVDWCNKTLFPLCRLMLEESLEGCHDILYYSNLLSCVELIKSGTTTMGLICKDGVVLAAERKATMGYMIASKDDLKITKIADHIGMTQAGMVGDLQALARYLKAETKLFELKNKKRITVMKNSVPMAKEKADTAYAIAVAAQGK